MAKIMGINLKKTEVLIVTLSVYLFFLALIQRLISLLFAFFWNVSLSLHLHFNKIIRYSILNHYKGVAEPLMKIFSLFENRVNIWL